MTVLWLIWWLLHSEPQVSFVSMNSWAVALLVCLAVDGLLTINHALMW